MDQQVRLKQQVEDDYKILQADYLTAQEMGPHHVQSSQEESVSIVSSYNIQRRSESNLARPQSTDGLKQLAKNSLLEKGQSYLKDQKKLSRPYKNVPSFANAKITLGDQRTHHLSKNRPCSQRSLEPQDCKQIANSNQSHLALLQPAVFHQQSGKQIVPLLAYQSQSMLENHSQREMASSNTSRNSLMFLASSKEVLPRTLNRPTLNRFSSRNTSSLGRNNAASRTNSYLKKYVQTKKQWPDSRIGNSSSIFGLPPKMMVPLQKQAIQRTAGQKRQYKDFIDRNKSLSSFTHLRQKSSSQERPHSQSSSPQPLSDKKKNVPLQTQTQVYEVPAVPFSIGMNQRKASISKDSICGTDSRQVTQAPHEMSFDVPKSPKLKDNEYNCKSERSNSVQSIDSLRRAKKVYNDATKARRLKQGSTRKKIGIKLKRSDKKSRSNSKQQQQHPSPVKSQKSKMDKSDERSGSRQKIIKSKTQQNSKEYNVKVQKPLRNSKKLARQFELISEPEKEQNCLLGAKSLINIDDWQESSQSKRERVSSALDKNRDSSADNALLTSQSLAQYQRRPVNLESQLPSSITKELMQSVLQKHRQKSASGLRSFASNSKFYYQEAAYQTNNINNQRQPLAPNQTEGQDISFLLTKDPSSQQFKSRDALAWLQIKSEAESNNRPSTASRMAQIRGLPQRNRPYTSQRRPAITIDRQQSKSKFIDGMELKMHHKQIEAQRQKMLSQQTILTSLTNQIFSNEPVASFEFDPISQCYVGFDYEKSVQHLTTFEVESTIPPITDIDDNLTMGSKFAAIDRRGITQYNVSKDNDGSTETVMHNPYGQDLVINDLADPYQTYAYENDLQIQENQFSTNRNENKKRINQSQNTQQLALTERLSSSQNQCHKASTKRITGVNPVKIKLQEKLGNSNRQNVQILKPKWVDQIDLRRQAEIGLKEQAIVFKRDSAQLFEKQLPVLVTAFSFYEKAQYREPLQAAPFEMISSEFTRHKVIESEQMVHMAKHSQDIMRLRLQMTLQLRLSLISYTVVQKQEDKSNELLEKIPFKLTQLDLKEVTVIDDINSIIYNATADDYQTVFCLNSSRSFTYVDECQKPLYKGDQRLVIDPEFESHTTAKQGDLRRMELTLLVIWQFASRVSAWLVKTASQARLLKELFRNSAEKEKFYQDALLEKGLANETQPLEFLDLELICEYRGKDIREQVYSSAKTKIAQVVSTCNEYGLVSPQLRDTALNTDYDALKVLNDQFDDVFNYQEAKMSKYDSIVTNFSTFNEKNQSKSEQVCSRIEAETLPLIVHQKAKLESSFAHQMGELMLDGLKQKEKYMHYMNHIFVNYKPLPESDDDKNDNHKILQKWSQQQKKSRSRFDHEQQIYRGWFYPLNAPDKLNFNFITSDYKDASASRLETIQSLIKLLPIDTGKKTSQVEKTAKMDEERHKGEVELYKSRLIPVDTDVCSDLFSVSVYKNELSFPTNIQNQDKESDLNDDGNQSEKKSILESPEDQSVLKDQDITQVASRMDVYQVYALTKGEKASWLEKNQLQRDLTKHKLTELKNQSIQKRLALLKEHVEEEKQEQQSDDHFYLETMKQLYRNDLVIRQRESEENDSSILGRSQADQANDQSSKISKKLQQSEKAQEEGSGQPSYLCSIKEAVIEEDALGSANLSEDSVSESNSKTILDLTKRTAQASLRSQAQFVQEQEPINSDSQQQTAKSVYGEIPGNIPLSGKIIVDQEDREQDFSDINSPIQDLEENQTQPLAIKERTRIPGDSARQDHIELVEKDSQSQVQDLEDESSDFSEFSDPDCDLAYRGTSHNQIDRQHQALYDNHSVQVAQKDDESESEDQGEQIKQEELVIVENHLSEIDSLGQVKTLLEHPDIALFDNWMESGAQNICFSWLEQDKKLKSNRFDILEDGQPRIDIVNIDTTGRKKASKQIDNKHINVVDDMLKFMQQQDKL